MADEKDFRSVISVINKGKQYPAISLVKTDPQIAATISKLTQGRERPMFDKEGNRSFNQTNRTDFETISADISEKANDSESIMQLFPEMELGAQILVSSIISPKDMSGGDVIYTAPNGLMPPDVIATLISKTREYLDTSCNIKTLLPKILREILFNSGSYPIVVIPESSIDDIINGTSRISTESFSEFIEPNGAGKSLGILGSPGEPVKISRTALESFREYKKSDNYQNQLTVTKEDKTRVALEQANLFITDNVFILKLPTASSRVKQGQINSVFDKYRSSLSMESFKTKTTKLTDAQMQALVYKSRSRDHQAIVRVKTKEQASRETVGKPLIMRLPSESVIPVHVPGDEEKHIGFFVLVDMEGNPLNRNTTSNHFGDLQTKLNSSNNSMGTYLLSKANSSMVGNGTKTLTVNNAAKLYTNIVESDLNERLRNGVYGNNVTLARNDEVYRIMLARALSNQYTQMLYIPAELMTYFAYKYDSNGVGKSLLDDMRILNSLRAMMMFSRVMASLKNSIGRTEVKLKLDEDDPDPNKTIETAIHEISKTRQQYFPLGMNSPTDLVDWIQRSGFEYSFEGHPKIPDMNIGFNEKSSNFPKPDTELDDELKKRSIMGIGLSPEMVDNGFGSEFAVNVVSNNLLLAKRVTQIQESFSPQLTNYARTILKNDGTMVVTIRGIITENYDKIKNNIESDEKLKGLEDSLIIDFLVNNYLATFELSLPQPNSVTIENQMTAFKMYSEGLDLALDAWINSDILNESMAGEVAKYGDNIKGIIKGYYLRKWMADNNVFNELTELTTKDENGSPGIDLMQVQSQHITGLVRSAVNLIKGSAGMAAAANKDINTITDEQGSTVTSDTSSEVSDNTDVDLSLNTDLNDTDSFNLDAVDKDDKPKDDITAGKKPLNDLNNL